VETDLVVEQLALQRLASIQLTHLRQLFAEPRVTLLDALDVLHDLQQRKTELDIERVQACTR